MKTTGTVKLTRFKEYMAWYSNLSCEEADSTYEKLSDWAKGIKNNMPRETHEADKQRIETVMNMARLLFQVSSYSNYPPENTKEYKWPRTTRKEGLRLMETLLSFATEFEQEVHVAAWWEGECALIYIGNPSKGIVVINPEEFLDYVPARDYTDITPTQMRMALGGRCIDSASALVPQKTQDTMTVKTAQRGLEAHEQRLDELKCEIERTKKAETPALKELKTKIETLQKELEAKKQTLMDELNQKLYEMEETKFQLEGQIFLLDAQIYSFRCYTGEVVKFTQLKRGKMAPSTEPIVIHQKLRFLDEELGKLASLYYLEWSEIKMFETFLQHHPLAMETFAPNERCVTLVRLSRNNKQIGMDGDRPYQNLLADYEYYHGSTVGVIIRSGEALWLGWTEPDRVHIDDDLIVSNIVTEVQPGGEPTFTFESDRRRYVEQQRNERKQVIDGIVSRSYIYSILQGIVDNTPILPLPDGVKLDKQGEYVVYAVADKWLTDNRFGTMSEIVATANSIVKEGDTVLTVQRLVPERYNHNAWTNGAWTNTRGIGERNRTHDCHVDDCTIYPVNEIIQDRNYFIGFYTESHGQSRVNMRTRDFYTRTAAEEHLAALAAQKPDLEVTDIEEHDGDRHIFVSVKKQGWSRYMDDQTTARANFELYKDEYINLSNLTSVHLEYAITNKHVIEGWSIGGKRVDYAYAIRYLRHAMKHIRAREAEEQALLDAVDPEFCKNTEWQLALLEFKQEKNVRNFTRGWAKRFINWFKNRAN